MSDARSAWIAPALAMLCAAAALTFSLRTALDTPSRIRQLERRRADAEQLAALAADRRADAARLAERTRGGPARPLGDWFRELHPDWTVELLEKDRTPVTADWSLQQTQVTMADVNLAELDNALQRLAAAEAPWRAVEWTLAASDAGPGRARVSLLMEGLVRTPASAP